MMTLTTTATATNMRNMSRPMVRRENSSFLAQDFLAARRLLLGLRLGLPVGLLVGLPVIGLPAIGLPACLVGGHG